MLSVWRLIFFLHHSAPALVKPVDSGDVVRAHPCCLSEGKIGISPGNDGRPAVSGEGEVAVMHDRVEVVRSDHVVGQHFHKI